MNRKQRSHLSVSEASAFVFRHRTAFRYCDFGVKYVYLRNEWVQVWHSCFVCAPFYTYDYSFSI